MKPIPRPQGGMRISARPGAAPTRVSTKDRNMPYATATDGTRLYWTESGHGDPLLLIMGLGYTSEMWFRILPPLAAHYRVLIFDNRGVGLSDAPAGPYLLPLMADDAAAVLDAAAAGDAHVFGISMGGMIAQEFALTHPARVQSLIVGCSTTGGAGATPAPPAVLEALKQRGSLPAETGVEVMVPYLYDDSTPRQRIDEDLVIRRRTYPVTASYEAQLAGVFAWTGTLDRLGSISVPTLVIHGANDRLIPLENAHTLARAIPGAQLKVLPDAGHVFITDQTDRTCEAVLAFLAEC